MSKSKKVKIMAGDIVRHRVWRFRAEVLGVLPHELFVRVLSGKKTYRMGKNWFQILLTSGQMSDLQRGVYDTPKRGVNLFAKLKNLFK